MFPSFHEQFNKLTEAYINEKLNPYLPCKCVGGTILNNTKVWSKGREYYGWGQRALAHASVFIESAGFYTLSDIQALETIFMRRFNGKYYDQFINEDDLFDALEETLEALQQLHIKKGEDISYPPVFKKRELKTV